MGEAGICYKFLVDRPSNEGSLSDSNRNSWAAQAEKLLLSLRDIISVSITLDADGETVTEISVFAEGNRPPKQIVRDVRSALRAEFHMDIDYRKISVAQKRHSRDPRIEPPPLSGSGGRSPVLTLPASRIREEPVAARLEFNGVVVALEQNSVTIQVDLALGERGARGEASGSTSRRQIPRLVVEATLDAVSKFLDPEYDLALADLELLRFSGDEVVLVGIRFFKGRTEKTLTGSCLVAHDLHQAVVYATLDALNRILGRLRYKEPVEFELRPTTMP